MSTNNDDDPVYLTVDMSDLTVDAGAQVMVEEVSQARRGEVRRFYQVDSNHRIHFQQPARSVELLTIPRASGSQSLVKIVASDDGSARGGRHRGSKFGSSPNLYAKADPENPDNRHVTFIKMQLGNIKPSDVDMAALRLWTRSGTSSTASSEPAVAHVYGIDNDSWDEGSLRWNVAPNISGTIGGVRRSDLPDVSTVADNFVSGVGTSAHVLGHITAHPAKTHRRVDVTDYLRSQDDSDRELTFMIIREVRHDTPSDLDPDQASIWMASRNGGSQSERPTLELVPK